MRSQENGGNQGAQLHQAWRKDSTLAFVTASRSGRHAKSIVVSGMGAGSPVLMAVSDRSWMARGGAFRATGRTVAPRWTRSIPGERTGLCGLCSSHSIEVDHRTFRWLAFGLAVAFMPTIQFAGGIGDGSDHRQGRREWTSGQGMLRRLRVPLTKSARRILAQHEPTPHQHAQQLSNHSVRPGSTRSIPDDRKRCSLSPANADSERGISPRPHVLSLRPG